MANQFVEYPYQVERAENGGYIVTDPRTSKKYAFANQADFTYWIGFNEQTPAVQPAQGSLSVGA